MLLRSSNIYLGATALLIMVLGGLFLYSTWTVQSSRPVFARNAALAGQLELTDLCLFTEASYTRHLSLTDLSTPFQDLPMSLEHFPSGSLVGPPPHLVRTYGKSD